MLMASLIGFVVVAGGFITLHFARKDKSNELKIAGWVLVVGGVLNLVAFGHYVSTMHQMGGPGAMMRMGGAPGMMMGNRMMLEAPPPPGAPMPPQAEMPMHGKKPAGKPASEAE